MYSRRRFMQSGALTAGAGLATIATRMNAQEISPLPASIAALKSMREQARPIKPAERDGRQQKARQLMQSNHLDALLLMEGTSLDYFTGVQWWGGERLFAVVMPAQGHLLCVCPAFEEGRAREQLAATPEGKNADLRTWQEDQDPWQLLAQGLKDLGLSTGTLGIEERIRFVFSDGIAKVAPQLKIASGKPVTAGCRMLKSDHELELMSLANKVTLTAFQAAYHAVRDGMTRPQLETLILGANHQLGFPGEVDIDIGENSSFPHGSIVPQVIREGTLVLLDGGGPVEGYQSDISRTFVYGKPSDKMKKVFDIVRHAQTAALKTARPGIECQAVDAAARQVISDAGYGSD